MSSQELIERIRAGNTDAIVHVQHAVFPNLKQWLVKRRANTDFADEICWMAWEAFYTKCQQPDFTLSGNWIGYVFNIGTNIFNKQQERSVKLSNETDLNKDNSTDFWERLITGQPDEAFSETDLAYRTLLKETFNLCLNYLKEDCRLIFKLTYWENKNAEEIAQVLQITNANARQRKTRCLEAIRKQMNQSGIFDELSNDTSLF